MHCVRTCAQASQHQVVNGFKFENKILKANPSCWSIKNAAGRRIVSNGIYRTFNASYRCSRGLAGVVAAASAESILSVLDNDAMSIQDLKALLKDTLWSTERGLSADSDTRAEILELISQLEARNPTPEPNESGGIDRLSGTWKLIYTSNSELLPLLALSRLPLVDVGDVTQTISADSLQVENKIQLSAPFSRTSLGASAVFEIRSPKLLQVQFEEGQVSTPEILSDFEIPSSLEVMGQNVDLSPLQNAFRPLDGPFRSTIQRIGSLLSEVPDLKVPISQGSKTST